MSSGFLQRYTYFQSLAAAYLRYLNALRSCWSDRATLEKSLQLHRDEAIATLEALQRPALDQTVTRRGVGLNTVGLLTDRLTILTIKEWCLRHRHRKPTAAQQLYSVQTHDILEALADAAPARGALNSKLTVHTPDLQAQTWAAAAYDLFATNVLIWKAQDYLYGTRLENELESGANAEERQGEPSKRSHNLLHIYTSWLPAMNVQRDGLIQRCERLYWQAGLAKPLNDRDGNAKVRQRPHGHLSEID